MYGGGESVAVVLSPQGDERPTATTIANGGRSLPIEKAFAIHAAPREIYAALERDLADAAEHEGTTHEVLRRERDRSIELRVTIGIVPCLLRYRIAPAAAHTEVIASLAPYGWKYAVFQMVTLGMRRSIFEFALVDALANLKAAVEDDVTDLAANGERFVSERDP
jgi:hypothetical protein